MAKDFLTLNLNGVLTSLSRPLVMGILNVTPDSFYALSRVESSEALISRVKMMLDEGADIIDVGACSTRPKSVPATEKEEAGRLHWALDIINREFPHAILSVDTFRSSVATECVCNHGVAIINDVSGGVSDEKMFDVAASLSVPYVLTHNEPCDAENRAGDESFFKNVFLFLAQRIERLQQMGVNDVIIDPGFGFGKTVEQNYRLMHELEELEMFHLPLLVGVSRKSMIWKPLNILPDEALNGTTVLNVFSLMHGVDILRVHDVKQAVEAVRLVNMIKAFDE